MRVLISGAGIAGPALAFHLSKGINAQVVVVEKSSQFLAQGQNIDVHGTALKIIRRMGLFEELKKLNTTEIGAKFFHPNGKECAKFPIRIEGVEGKCGSPTSEYEILRGDLAKMLYDSTLQDKNIQYLLGTTVESVLDNGQDSVKVRLSDGTEDEFDLLVAADGQWSKIRKQCFDPETIEVVDKNNYLVYWTAPRVPEDDNWWKICFTNKSRAISLRPDPHGTIRPMLSMVPRTAEKKEKLEKASRSGDKQVQMALLKEEFQDAGWITERLLNTMADSNDFYFQAVKQIRMKTWSTGRIVCLGDAAYAPTPLTGMGTPLAILGAYVLAGELSLLKTGQHPKEALIGFEKAFKPFVDETQNIPSFVPSIFYPTSTLGCRIMANVFWLISKVVSSAWFVRKYGQYEEEDDYKLKEYPILEKIAVNNEVADKH